ncbi:MAG: hemerythrin domain-containing protein [Myxococcales bacterium]|nr:hemerythrin domain-containing protein [Myxococcales bacterium]
MRPDDAAADFFVDKLASSHERHGVVLGELGAVFRALAGGGSVDDAARRQLEDGARYLSRSLPRHYADEEATFFPRVLASAPDAAPQVEQLIREHAEHTAAHARVIAAAYDVLDGNDASAAYYQGMVAHLEALTAAAAEHIRLEDAWFAAWSSRLTDAQRTEMETEFRNRRGGGRG